MGVFVGLLAGLGVLLVLASGRPRGPDGRRGRRWPAEWLARRRALLVAAGWASVPVLAPPAAGVALGLATGIVVLVVSSTWALGLAFGVAAGLAPGAVLRRRSRLRSRELREVWPEVVDNLASAVRAGMALPEGLAAIGTRGPEPLRPAFRRFGADYRATGAFGACLDRLADDLAEPVGDRIVASLRVAREVGGTDLGRLLRTLSAFLREDARTRAELETRQGWQVNAARLALAAPWAVLLLLAVRGGAIQAYDRPGGVLVLLVGGVLSVAAYRVMRRIARLPEERR